MFYYLNSFFMFSKASINSLALPNSFISLRVTMLSVIYCILWSNCCWSRLVTSKARVFLTELALFLGVVLALELRLGFIADMKNKIYYVIQ